MNITEYIYLINKPEAINEKQTVVLEKIVQEFPYFQSARALYLKGLYNQNSFKYNYVLKVTAAHTNDRSILFDFITSDTFTSVHKELFEQKLSDIAAITVSDSEVVEPRLEIRENSVEQSILSSIEKAGQEAESNTDVPAELATETIPTATPYTAIDSEEPPVEISPVEAADQVPAVETDVAAEVVFERLPEPETQTNVLSETLQAEQNLEMGKPLSFSQNEKHSFQEWLQLSAFKPIDRSKPEPETVVPETETQASESFDPDPGKQKKNELIDRFIETNPKIPPVKTDAPLSPSAIVEPSMADKSFLMTETLARVYLEQKKYNKAIQAYEILILKYPEKSSFFADRILDIKNLQQNNK